MGGGGSYWGGGTRWREMSGDGADGITPGEGGGAAFNSGYTGGDGATGIVVLEFY